MASNPGGCGAQGGGSGGTVCVGSGVLSVSGWSQTIAPCDAAHKVNDGLTYQCGYSERWDGYPACDTVIKSA